MSLSTAPNPLFTRYRNRLLVALGIALVLRLVLMAVPLAFWTDLNTFKAWSVALISVG